MNDYDIPGIAVSSLLVGFVGVNLVRGIIGYYSSKAHLIREQAIYALRSGSDDKERISEWFERIFSKDGFGSRLALERFKNGRFDHAIEARMGSTNF